MTIRKALKSVSAHAPPGPCWELTTFPRLRSRLGNPLFIPNPLDAFGVSARRLELPSPPNLRPPSRAFWIRACQFSEPIMHQNAGFCITNKLSRELRPPKSRGWRKDLYPYDPLPCPSVQSWCLSASFRLTMALALALALIWTMALLCINHCRHSVKSCCHNCKSFIANILVCICSDHLQVVNIFSAACK